ncbi:MAG: hypothetical protein M1508_11690 [Nitrospirae bacterium]|nr:hypothetical protein [Nitrospirota bacterium]MCL5423195.1 hypothetical protein [Nitrospirota bacterium]
MSKSKFSKSKKYLTAKEFIEHCKAHNVDASLDALEAYEKTGLLYPIYRLVAPDEYVCALFEHNHKRPYDPNIPFDKEDKWRQITELENALSAYCAPPLSHFKEALKNGHPLDHAYESKNQFLCKPSIADFRPWEEYQIVAGKIGGDPVKEDVAEHYYMPWQIVVMEELNFMHTIEENYVVRQKKGWGILGKDIYPTKLFKYFETFQTVSNFRMLESLIWHDITFGLKQSVIEGSLNEQLRARTIEAARQEYERHPHAFWIEFVRKLVELYNDYLEKEMIRLSKEVKSYLTSTLNIMIDASHKSFEGICHDYDGRFRGYRQLCREEDTFIYPGELERIFPDEFAQARKKAAHVLDIYIKEFNQTLKCGTKINERIKDDLIANIVESGHMLLLSHIHEIEKQWFDRGPHWEGSIWAHLRSFAVSIESIGQEWYDRTMLGKILEIAFEDYEAIRKAVGEKITDAKSLEDFRHNFKEILKWRGRNSSNGLCGYHLLVAHLTRNYFSHKIMSEADMLGSIFLEVYKALILTLISLFVRKLEIEATRAKRELNRAT